MDPEGWGHQSNPEQILQAPVGSNAMLLCIWVRVRPHLSKHNLPCYNLWTFQQTLKHLLICKWMSSSKKKKESSSKTELGRLLSQWPAEKKMCCWSLTDYLACINELLECHLKPCWAIIKSALSACGGQFSVASTKNLRQSPPETLCVEKYGEKLKKIFF